VGQYFNNGENDFLWTLLANPANDAHVHAYDLQQLVNEFPQSGILQALLARASDEKNLKRASVYFNPGSLYKLINAPLSLTGVSDERIIIEPGIGSSYRKNDEYLPEAEDTDLPPEISRELNDSENYFNEQSETVPGADDQEQEYDHYAVIHEEAEPPVKDEEAGNYYFTEAEADEITVEGAAETEPAEAPASLIPETEPEIAADVHQESPIGDELIEVYEAMSSRIKSALEGQVVTNDGNAEQAEPIEADKEMPQEQPVITAQYVHIDEHEEKQPDIEDAVYDPEPKDAPLSAEQGMSMYHDEKMPYTFMWWLDKTRREHSGVLQPYAKAENVNPDNKQKNIANELQQQYFENIFHITSVEELDKNTAPHAPNGKLDIKQKEQIIIQRFIEEEPQIRPQSSDKLDNENKAR
jgi:hypothetical protein